MNRDAYYSKAVVDVSKGGTVTLPNVPEGTYMAMQPLTEDHRPQPMSYGAGTYEYNGSDSLVLETENWEVTYLDGSNLHMTLTEEDGQFHETECIKN